MSLYLWLLCDADRLERNADFLAMNNFRLAAHLSIEAARDNRLAAEALLNLLAITR